MDEHSTGNTSEHASWRKEVNAEMEKLGTMLKDLGPSDQVKDHFRNSRVEFLKGLRRMLDDKIERAQSHGKSQGTSIPIE